MTILSTLLLLATSVSQSAPVKTCTNPNITATAVSAALDEQDGLYNLAVEFYAGRCLEKSYEKAARLWEKYLVSNGLGVAKDESRAALLWEEAAMKGHSEAQLHLWYVLFYGVGVTQDRARGLAWVLLSAETAKTVPNNPEGGGGEKILKWAQDRKADMLSEAPDLLPAATDIAAHLLDHLDER